MYDTNHWDLFETDINYIKDHFVGPPSLRSLTVNFQEDPNMENLRYWVKTLAGQTDRLESFSSQCTTSKPYQFRADHFLTFVAQRHGPTLKQLRVPNMSISSKLLGLMLTRCPQLEELLVVFSGKHLVRYLSLCLLVGMNQEHA